MPAASSPEPCVGQERLAALAHGPPERGELAQLVGARYWGPGVFSAALRKALAQGRVRRLTRTTFAPADTGNDDPAGEHNQ